MRRNHTWILAFLACITVVLPTRAQNEITHVSPDSADLGTTGLLVTFSLDTDFPPAPPQTVPADSATIGTIHGTSVTHVSQYVVTAVFDIPAGELLGPKDCEVTFTIPPSNTLTFSKTGGFTVTGDAPPTVTRQPRSITVRELDPVTFIVEASGTEPLSYQWHKDGQAIGGATDARYPISQAHSGDAGVYTCEVTNVFGTDTSDAATLTYDYSVPVLAATYPLVDTMQYLCYDDEAEMTCPMAGQRFHGQDGQHDGYLPLYGYVPGIDVTVYDAVTGLTWQQSPDTNGDGVIDVDDKFTWTEVQGYPDTLNAANFGGYDDWRLPTIKELYSLMDFRGEDPSGVSGDDTSGLTPFLDTDYFEFGYGDTNAGERIIDAQFATSTEYVWTTMGGNHTMFGVNFADGRIKGYPTSNPQGGEKEFYVLCVRGNTGYGINDFVDNGDGTITDRATGLMWAQDDNGNALTWEAALAYVETRNATSHLGYEDWRLPNAKELQSILDYTRSPDTDGTAAIDPVFSCTSIVNGSCASDFPWYWSSTTHANSAGGGFSGAYVCFGRAMGYMANTWMDVHGAGAQRSDRKDGDVSGSTALDCGYYSSVAPQGDETRPGHYVRLVRGGNGPLYAGFSYTPQAPTDATPVSFSASASGGTSPFTYTWDIGGTPAGGQTVERTLPVGTHTVTLTVTDAASLETVISEEISVGATSPPPVADGKLAGEAARFTRNAGDPSRIDVTYGTSPCSGSQAVILYGNLGDFSGYAGSAQDDAGNGGVAVIDASALDNVWFNIVWTSGTTAGHPGYGFDGATDVERSWNAAGLAGLTDDDDSDGTCD